MEIYNPKETFFRILLTFYAGFVAYYSLKPAGVGTSPQGILPGLLGMHALAYFVMALLAVWAFPRSFERSRVKIIFYVFLYGLVIELLQIPMGNHYFSWLDLLANLVGAVLVWFEPVVKGLFRAS